MLVSPNVGNIGLSLARKVFLDVGEQAPVGLKKLLMGDDVVLVHIPCLPKLWQLCFQPPVINRQLRLQNLDNLPLTQPPVSIQIHNLEPLVRIVVNPRHLHHPLKRCSAHWTVLAPHIAVRHLQSTAMVQEVGASPLAIRTAEHPSLLLAHVIKAHNALRILQRPLLRNGHVLWLVEGVASPRRHQTPIDWRGTRGRTDRHVAECFVETHAP
mmetsp:Transcript_18681/g.47113  ORF Transcript_18681/g.47113 Transcript_18681/m.47113 type:complete len:212 (-) Transcript_18681:490-1125(-)